VFAISVPPGQYKLSVQLAGFKTVKLKVTVTTGETVQQLAKEVRAAQR
jgi:hypothetical protein